MTQPKDRTGWPCKHGSKRAATCLLCAHECVTRREANAAKIAYAVLQQAVRSVLMLDGAGRVTPDSLVAEELARAHLRKLVMP